MADATSQVIIGIDSSTQSTKLEAFTICYEHDGTVALGSSIFSTKVTYVDDLPHLCSDQGEAVRTDSSTGSAVQPPALWFSALDTVLMRASDAGVTARAAAVSISAQQHAAVYWAETIGTTFAACAAEGATAAQCSIADVFTPALALQEVPIWMDSSTSAECTSLARSLGGGSSSGSDPTKESLQLRGNAYLAAVTGSSAYERFTLPQCVSLAQRQPASFAAVRHVRLLSAALTGILAGELTPHDASDAAGMNALRLPCAPSGSAQGGAWSWDAGAAAWAQGQLAGAGCTAQLEELLGSAVDVTMQARQPSAYIVSRFGLPPSCAVVTGSGDNPCALAVLAPQNSPELPLAGLAPQFSPELPRRSGGPETECTIISLGTSDTVLGTGCWGEVVPQAGKGHVLPDPLRPETHCMTMLCVKHGGMVRQRLAEECTREGRAGAADEGVAPDWEAFDAACAAQLAKVRRLRAGDSVSVGLLLPLPEIAPHTTEPCELWWTATALSGQGMHLEASTAPEGAMQRAGAAAMGQLCNLAVQARALRGAEGGGRQLRVTGGGAKSDAFVQMASYVFGSAVCSTPPSQGQEGAARGAAVRAFHAWAAAQVGGGKVAHKSSEVSLPALGAVASAETADHAAVDGLAALMLKAFGRAVNAERM